MTYFKDPEHLKETWKEWLDAFREEIYPMFKAQGISFENAVVLYRQNMMLNTMWDMEEPKDDWRQE